MSSDLPLLTSDSHNFRCSYPELHGIFIINVLTSLPSLLSDHCVFVAVFNLDSKIFIHC